MHLTERHLRVLNKEKGFLQPHEPKGCSSPFRQGGFLISLRFIR
jgi:hypothetical protein